MYLVSTLARDINKVRDSGHSFGRRQLDALLEYYWALNSLDPSESRLYLSGVNLSGLDLRGINLRGAVLNSADLSSADLSGADLREATLERARLTEAVLVRANLSKSDLFRARLYGAHADFADFTGAVVNEADMRAVEAVGTNFTGVCFDRALLEGDVRDAALKIDLGEYRYEEPKPDPTPEPQPDPGSIASINQVLEELNGSREDFTKILAATKKLVAEIAVYQERLIGAVERIADASERQAEVLDQRRVTAAETRERRTEN